MNVDTEMLKHFYGPLCTLDDWKEKPFFLAGWIIATNGHGIIAVRGEAAGWNGFDSSRTRVRPETVLFFVTGAGLSDETFPLQQLRDFVTASKEECSICKGTDYVPCEVCAGTGFVDCVCPECDHKHKATCVSCDGGMDACDCAKKRRYVEINSMVFDANLIRNFLKPVLAENYRAAPIVKGKALIIGGEDWRVAIMPTRLEASPNYPKFQIRVGIKEEA